MLALQKYHPDAHPLESEKKKAQEKFTEVSAAYTSLNSATGRANAASSTAAASSSSGGWTDASMHEERRAYRPRYSPFETDSWDGPYTSGYSRSWRSKDGRTTFTYQQWSTSRVYQHTGDAQAAGARNKFEEELNRIWISIGLWTVVAFGVLAWWMLYVSPVRPPADDDATITRDLLVDGAMTDAHASLHNLSRVSGSSASVLPSYLKDDPSLPPGAMRSTKDESIHVPIWWNSYRRRWERVAPDTADWVVRTKHHNAAQRILWVRVESLPAYALAASIEIPQPTAEQIKQNMSWAEKSRADMQRLREKRQYAIEVRAQQKAELEAELVAERAQKQGNSVPAAPATAPALESSTTESAQ